MKLNTSSLCGEDLARVVDMTDLWLLDMESIFRVIRFPKEEKVPFALCTLKGATKL